MQLTMEGLLANNRGQCTAWAELLVETFGAQGIFPQTENITFGNPNYGDKFAVGGFPAQGSSNAVYTVGTKGAGGFTFHQVVRVGFLPDCIIDPSYGNLTVPVFNDPRSTEQIYEDRYITDCYSHIISGWIANQVGDGLQSTFN